MEEAEKASAEPEQVVKMNIELVEPDMLSTVIAVEVDEVPKQSVSYGIRDGSKAEKAESTV